MYIRKEGLQIRKKLFKIQTTQQYMNILGKYSFCKILDGLELHLCSANIWCI